VFEAGEEHVEKRVVISKYRQALGRGAVEEGDIQEEP
jgi:hypothetical protein